MIPVNLVTKSEVLIARVAALKIVIDIVCDKSCYKFPFIADRFCLTGHIQILRKYEFDASDKNVTAVWLCVLKKHPIRMLLIYLLTLSVISDCTFQYDI